RPFVYRLAKIHRLGGSVGNGQHGVVVDAEGDREGLARVLGGLWSTAPSLGRLLRLTTPRTAPRGHGGEVRNHTRPGEGGPARFSPLPTCPSASRASRRCSTREIDDTPIRS